MSEYIPYEENAKEIYADLMDILKELREIKEKYRWRQQSFEPCPSGIRIEILSPDGNIRACTSDSRNKLYSVLYCYPPCDTYWRPIDDYPGEIAAKFE